MARSESGQEEMDTRFFLKRCCRPGEHELRVDETHCQLISNSVKAL